MPLQPQANMEGAKEATTNLKPAPTERAGALLGSLWDCFAGTLGSLCALWVYFGDIGAVL